MKYPIGIQTFSEIREENYVYIDKTALVHQLITCGKNYFLSRPRRFGKSLLLSTLEAVFLGRRALFDGLSIAKTDYDFATYPVIKMEFTRVNVRQVHDLESYIINTANSLAKTHDIELELDSYEQRFAELVIKLQQKYQQKVVLLIDEYDKPILSNLNKPILEHIKESLNGFYSSIKSLDEYLKFVFITGVSKFAKVSVFSGMNNLDDISMDRCYATLCGISQAEMEDCLGKQIEALASKLALTTDVLKTKIKYWYNGYRFEEDAISVYNPYSLIFLFAKQKFDNYWFATGTPTFLIELIKAKQFNLAEISDFEIDRSAFMSIEPEQISPLIALLQTGYLTIADFDDGWYRLDFPNYEVKYAFNQSIVENLSNTEPGVNVGYIRKLCRALNKANLDDFFEILQVFFANIPNTISIKQEKYYQSLFYSIFTLIGYKLEAEVSTNKGRIDCVIHTDSTIYIIEFKLNDSCDAALKQIEEKQYAQKYLHSDKNITLVGVAFDQQTRNIGDYVEKRFSL